MKSKFIFISSLFAVSALIILGGVWLLGDRPEDARDLDILNNTNLIREINVVRAGEGLDRLQEDAGLSELAQKNAEDAGTGKAVESVYRQVTVRYDELSGVEPQQFYSTRRFMERLVAGSGMRGIVFTTRSRIGAWVTYVAETDGAKPIVWVSIIVK